MRVDYQSTESDCAMEQEPHRLHVDLIPQWGLVDWNRVSHALPVDLGCARGGVPGPKMPGLRARSTPSQNMSEFFKVLPFPFLSDPGGERQYL